MAKRANPFIEDYIPQRKIHVSLKQFNNNDDRLQKVYVKTLDLLYKGAQKSQPQGNANSNNNDAMKIEKKNKMKQLFIGKNGTLLDCGNMVCNNNNSSEIYCSCGAKCESKCAYCEVSLCSTCQHLCAQCERSHCNRCTLVGFEGSEVCFSCYT